MKRLLVTFVMLFLMLAGCQNQQQKNKKAALERWNTARVELTLNMARQQYQAGELDKAATATRQVLEAQPDHLPALVLMGRIHLEQNQAGSARVDFEKCLKVKSDYAEAHHGLGVVYEKSNHLAEALAQYRLALTAAPEYLPYALAVAETCAAQKLYSEALDTLTPFMQGADPSACVYLLAGHIYTRMEQPPQALKMYQEAYNLSPEDADVAETLALAQYQMGHAEDALALLKKLAENPQKKTGKSGWLYDLAMGDCYLQLGQAHEAQRCYERIADRAAIKPEVWTRLAQAAVSRQDWQRAGHCAQQALDLQAKNTEAILVLGYVALKQRNYAEASMQLERAVSIDARHGLAYCLLGQTYQELNQPDKATRCYLQAQALNPQDALAAQGLADMRISVGQSPAAKSF